MQHILFKSLLNKTLSSSVQNITDCFCFIKNRKFDSVIDSGISVEIE